MVVAVVASACTTTSHSSTETATGSRSSALPASSTTTTSPFADNPSNVYANAAVGKFSANVRGVPTRIYVPNSESNTVDEIDPVTMKVTFSFPVPRRPQHVVPSWDMRTLYVNSDLGNALTPIDPMTGKPGPTIPVDDPYNLYFTPDGSHAIVVPEKFNSLDFRDPHTFQLVKRVPLPCHFPNHMDFTADQRFLAVSCEGSGQLVRVDVKAMSVVDVIDVGHSPQDIRLSADGNTFYVADQDDGGVYTVDAHAFRRTGFIATGKGTHGMYPSRDASRLYISNRITGSISVLDYATQKVVATWPVSGGSPDMGGVSADGSQLWLSGRYNSAIYVFDTSTGGHVTIPVGKGPHGLCLFPQPGKISLGHTGNYR